MVEAALQRAAFSTEGGKGGAPPTQEKTFTVNKMNQVRAYKADPKISLIIKSTSPNDETNSKEKERYNKQIRECALGLYKNYKKSTNK